MSSMQFLFFFLLGVWIVGISPKSTVMMSPGRRFHFPICSKDLAMVQLWYVPQLYLIIESKFSEKSNN